MYIITVFVSSVHTSPHSCIPPTYIVYCLHTSVSHPHTTVYCLHTSVYHPHSTVHCLHTSVYHLHSTVYCLHTSVYLYTVCTPLYITHILLYIVCIPLYTTHILLYTVYILLEIRTQSWDLRMRNAISGLGNFSDCAEHIHSKIKVQFLSGAAACTTYYKSQTLTTNYSYTIVSQKRAHSRKSTHPLLSAQFLV